MTDIRERTFEFATRVVRLCRVLEESPGVSRTLANQLPRSGTSIGANVEEAHGSHSKPDFIAKMSIANKEARETNYWLRLLAASDVIAAEKLTHRFQPQIPKTAQPGRMCLAYQGQ
jgi:four helix bundle protein